MAQKSCCRRRKGMCVHRKSPFQDEHCWGRLLDPDLEAYNCSSDLSSRFPLVDLLIYHEWSSLVRDQVLAALAELAYIVH
jgi:hypothetical protein